MKQVRISFIVILFLFSVVKNMQAMEKVKKMPALVADDTAILPITVNLEDHKNKIIYSSQWNEAQVKYVKLLDNQNTFQEDSVVTIPHSFVPIKQPETIKKIVPTQHLKIIEKIALLLSITQGDDSKQKSTVEDCLEQTKRSPRFLLGLLKTADFIDCPIVTKACQKQIIKQTKALIQQSKLRYALKLLDSCDVHHVSVQLGNLLMQASPETHHLLMRMNPAIKFEEKNHNNWNRWANHDNLLLKSIVAQNHILKFWHNCEFKTLHLNKNQDIYPANDPHAWPLARRINHSWICPSSNKLFCIFRSEFNTTPPIYCEDLETYELSTGNFLCSKRISPDFSHIRYCPQQNLLFLINRSKIKKYLLEYENKTTTYSKINSSCTLNKMSSFAFNETNGIMYVALEKQGIFKYNPTKNTLKKYFFNRKKSQRRHISSLCLSPDKKTLYSLSTRTNKKTQNLIYELCFYNIKKRKIYKVIPLKDCSPHNLIISPNGSLLALKSNRRNVIILLDAKSGRTIKTINDCYFPAVFSFDSKTLAARNNQGYVEHTMIDTNIEQELHNCPIQHIALLHACASILENKKRSLLETINLSTDIKEIFEQLPEKIQSYLNRRAIAEL